MKQTTNALRFIPLILLLSAFAFAQRPTETGGPVSYEQAAYDVQKYDITLRINPAEKSISGATVVTAKIVHPINVFVLDLDTPFKVSDVSLIETGVNAKLEFEHREGKIRSQLPSTKQPGETVKVRVTYAGIPRVAPNPPWVGGFMWSKTKSGADWIATAVQNDGADLIFACKDVPSDKPETTELHITVPADLYVATAGKLQRIEDNPDKTKTFHWLMSNPIPNYGLALNIAPYRIIEDEYKSSAGETFPVIFYVLPEDYEKGAKLIEETKKYLAFFEEYLGPYPFRAEKLGIAHTPHLGMEHSTIIAYGNKFNFAADGFDWLMFHELGHEWWANLVTASDWRDFWIHEGFQSFLDTFYMEKTRGKEAYFEAMKNRVKGLKNKQAVAPREPKFSYQVYYTGPDYVSGDGDIYAKGALILHTLRYLIGDEAFFRAVRRMAYPTKEMEKYTEGRQTRFVNTDDFLKIAEEESKMDLDWFFEVYLRQPALPKLITERNGLKINLRWETPNGLPFPMPVEIERDGVKRRIEMPGGRAELDVGGEDPYEFDPNGWILKTDSQNDGTDN